MANTLPIDKIVPKKGSIAYFAPEGETIETVTVASDEAPAGSDFSDWEEIGCIEDAELNPPELEGGETHDCFDATTGEWNEIESAAENAQVRQTLNILFKKVTPWVLQMAWAAESVGSSDGAFVPGSQPGGAYKGFIFIQTQRKTELETVVKLWCSITVADATKIANRTEGHKPRITVRILKNALNAGTMGTNS